MWDEVDTLRIWYVVIFKVLCVSLDNVTQVTHHAWENFLSLVNVDNLWKSSSSDVLRVYMQYNYLYDFYKVFGIIHIIIIIIIIIIRDLVLIFTYNGCKVSWYQSTSLQR